MKLCSKCGEEKDRGLFNKRAKSKDGLCAICRDCSAAKNAEWRASNPDGFKRWLEKNKESRAAYMADWYQKNKERRAANYRDWQKANSARMAERNQERYARKLRATPAWANKEKILEFYNEAARLTKETGIRHEVDHIIPLKGEGVCGLHCEFNLQILTRSENARKKNRIPESIR